MSQNIQTKIEKELNRHAVDFFYFADLSEIATEDRKDYPSAILFGKALSKKYLLHLSQHPDYVFQMKQNQKIEEDEFHLTEKRCDEIADQLANYIESLGFQAYSQSERNILQSGHYQADKKSTPLPHKTIAGYAGMGWIGKHNLLTTKKYGSAISMCTVLTNAPLQSIAHPIQDSLCGTCSVCENSCESKAIKGENWNCSRERDDLVNVYKCTTCLQCMVACPWTQRYAVSC